MGITDEYVRQLWVRCHLHETASVGESLEAPYGTEPKEQSHTA